MMAMTVSLPDHEVQMRLYTTGQLAEYFGVSQATICNYCNQKIIRGLRNPERGWWYITQDEVDRIERVVRRKMKQKGFMKNKWCRWAMGEE